MTKKFTEDVFDLGDFVGAVLGSAFISTQEH